MFIKYPHTPHLAWLGSGIPRGDKVFTEDEQSRFLEGALIIEEKVDGANIGISILDGDLAVQNRGEYLRHPANMQFSPLWPWLENHRPQLTNELGSNLILFGEWCYAVHTVRYDALPDWFLGFDVYDRKAEKYWSAARRNELLKRTGLCAVPEIGRGRFDIRHLKELATTGASRYGNGPLEGLYLRRESGAWLDQRAKIVRPEFSQSIQEHWSSRSMERNHLRLAG